uniref:Mitochondrial ribosomal protein L48 n=1 Tax=Monodelphis domestica TaxID=13616 RepID=A0A5F8H2C4_MONDO
MSSALGKVLCPRKDVFSKQALSLLRFQLKGENPSYSAGSILLSSTRPYKSQPTHGIGRYKHLIIAPEISNLSSTFASIFLEILQSNLPEGVNLSVREHTEEAYKGRFKTRPELEELLAKVN